MISNDEIVKLVIDIPAEQYVYLKRLAADEGLTVEEIILQCLPDQMLLAEKIMRDNREVLKRLAAN